MNRLALIYLPAVLCWLWIASAPGWFTAGGAWAQEEQPTAAEQAAAASEAAAPADETTKPAAKPPAADSPPPPSTEVKQGTVRIALELEAVAEPATTREITVRPDEWTASGGLTVKNAAKHGARVKKGEVLIAFDTSKIDRTIEDLQTELKIGELSLQQAEQQLQALEETTPLELAAAKRAGRTSEEDRKFYFDRQRPFDTKATEYQLQSAKNSLEYAQEELDQLRKMYEADDLTEETEGIVLKRAENSLKSAQMQLESAQMRHDLATGYTLGREDERVKESSLRQRLATQRAEINLPLALEKQRLDMANLAQQQARSREKLQKLQADREQLTIKSPIEGIVYYGKFARGKLSDSTSLADNLRPLGTVQPNQVLMTVAQPQPLSIRAAVPEDKLHRLRVGLTGKVVPKAYPDLKLPAVVNAVSPVPLGPGSFDAQLKLTRSKEAEQLLPGMACTVKLEPYVKHDALYVPPKVVMQDERDPDKRYVWLLQDAGPVRREVTVGEQTDAQAEILKGLAAGDRVLLEAPKQAD